MGRVRDCSAIAWDSLTRLAPLRSGRHPLPLQSAREGRKPLRQLVRLAPQAPQRLALTGEALAGGPAHSDAVGAEVVLLAVVAVPAVHLLGRRTARRGRVRSVLASGIAALALTQVFGLTATGLAPIGIAAEAPGVTNAAKEAQAIAQPPAAADLAARMAHMDAPLPAFWIDLAPMQRLQRVLRTDQFSEAARLAVTGDASQGEQELVIFRNNAPLPEHPAIPALDILAIGKTIKTP